MKNTSPLKILYVDDDIDDHFIFSKILDEIEIDTQLTSIMESERLIIYILQSELPDLIFLDLNMPRKNGYECLTEIKRNTELKHIPIVIYSTSYHKNIVDLLFEAGAFYCIRKCAETTITKKIISCVLDRILKNKVQPTRKEFVLGFVEH
jgi:PleD family two-component response regulator